LDPLRVGHDGVARNLPGSGGITYNVKIGDSAMGWAGDHVEPGVTVRNQDSMENGALQSLSCVGNQATVVGGDAKGAKGYVTGTHGGIEDLICYFDSDALESLVIGDKIQVRAWGQGIEFVDHPGVKIKNLDPDLLEKLGLRARGDDVEVPVSAIIPPQLMGSGLGATSERGDYDIVTNDLSVHEKYGLGDLRLGDVVAITDHDNTVGRAYREGAVTVGVIVHADSYASGHGPGVTTLLTSRTGKLKPVIDKTANIARYLGV
jgi:hypothetical protein